MPALDLTPRPLVQTTRPAEWRRRLGPDHWLLDFDLAYFGTVTFDAPAAADGQTITLHLAEKLADDDQGVDREPPGCIRYRQIDIPLSAGQTQYRATIPPDERNTGKAAILMPPEIGEVFPFRYCEIQGPGVDDIVDSVRQIAVHTPFDDDAGEFESGDEVLDAVWRLCKHSIKATTFCGIYVDGDRERIPYEGDAYINQLSHYAVDAEPAYAIARHSLDYLLDHPTWPSDWQFHCVLMAWADYLYTGDAALLRQRYELLHAKTLIDLARPDGLLDTARERITPELIAAVNLDHDRCLSGPENCLRDLVDWPPGSFTQGGTGERDDHEMLPVNTVINAFHFRSLVLMGEIAAALDHPSDAADYRLRAEQVYTRFQQVFYDDARGVYVDGEGSAHASLHANMFPLAFGLVPRHARHGVVAHIKSRGMACSVYGAQYLLDGLFAAGEDHYAIDLMRATHDRSWWNMIAAGSTITLEAWDWRYKNNLDWNHAWGAAPGNVIVRRLLGVRPAAPGFDRARIQPRLGPLSDVDALVPTRHGPIEMQFRAWQSTEAELDITLPPGMIADLHLPPGGWQLDDLPVIVSELVHDLAPGPHTLRRIRQR